MTLEERVRRIEEWIIAPNLKAGLRIRDAIRASLDAPCDEPAGARHYCAKHAVGSAYGCGARKGERIAALEAERDSLRDERDAEQRRAMAAESDSDVLREECDSLRAQLADAHRVLAQGETIDAATERDTREGRPVGSGVCKWCIHAERIRSLSPEGWRGVREADLAVLKEAAHEALAHFYAPLEELQQYRDRADEIRAAIARMA